MNSSKHRYNERLPKKLNDLRTAIKTYWSILIGVTDFLVKANLFNKFFSQQCTTIIINSSIPKNTAFETENRLSAFEFSISDIIKVIRAFYLSKAHGHDEISIHIIKSCASSISKTLHIIFKNCLEKECFHKEWKRVVPVYKKSNKQLINNNWPLSLLTICAKVFETIIFNSLFKYFYNNNLLHNNQSNFRPGDSSLHHLFSIIHDIYKAFDTNNES